MVTKGMMRAIIRMNERGLRDYRHDLSYLKHHHMYDEQGHDITQDRIHEIKDAMRATRHFITYEKHELQHMNS